MTGDEIVALSTRHTLFEWAAQDRVDPIPVARAKGIYFWTPEGQRFVDFNSQLMSVNIGHGDERVIAARNLEEVSIGDYVLAGGEVAAMVLLEAVVRLIPGVLGGTESHADESFENGVLEYPQFTRPQNFEGREIPAVLTSGNHAEIEKWRREMSELLTRARRPDLLK